MPLFPVLNRVKRKTKLRGKLSLTQSHFGTQFSYVHLRRRNVGDSHTAWLALYPVSRLLCAAKQSLAEQTLFHWLLPAASFHFSFLPFQSVFSACSCLVGATLCR